MMKLRKVLDGSKGGSAILRAIKNWTLDPTAEGHSSTNTVNSEAAVSRAMASRQAIGWEHIFRGFVSLEWSNFYAATDFTPPEARRTRAISLLPKFVKGFQDYTLFLWKCRNDVLHEAGSDGIETVHATLSHDITQMYSLKDTLHSQLQS